MVIQDWKFGGAIDRATMSVLKQGRNMDGKTTTVWIGAFRYYLGRQSYAVSNFCDYLLETWESLPEDCQSVIQRELKEAIAKDNEQRELGGKYLPLGMDCDRQNWVKVFERISEVKHE